jgi:hypothetical protein
MSNKQKTNNRNKRGYALLPYPVIAAATNGDVSAINKVLKHYEGYIVALSMSEQFDEQGNGRLIYDEEKRRTLETKLITNLSKFRTV